MKVKLNWTLGSLTPQGQQPTTLVIQDRLSSVSQWTTRETKPYAEFCTAGACQYTYVDGVLLPNLSYDFRIGTNCAQGTISYSNVFTKLNIVCPEVTITKTSSTISYSFPGAVGTAVTGYTVALYAVSDTSFSTPLGQEELVSYTPTPASVNGTITGLSAETSYVLRVVVKSSAPDKSCTYPTSTDATVSCNAATNLTACICGVDCAQACS